MNDDKMTPRERRATWGLGAVFSLRVLGMFMVLPVLTTWGMVLSGASEVLIGIAIGIYGLTQAIFQIPLGLLADRIGRKPLIVSGLLLFALGSLIAAMSHSIWGVILGRALQGSGAIAAAVMALLSDLTREQNRTKAMAFIGASFGITFAIAMVLGPLVAHAFGLQALFWSSALLAISGIFVTLWVIPSANTRLLNREASMVKGSFGKVWRNRRLLKLDLGILCLHFLLMANFVALPQVLAQHGLASHQHWKVWLVTMLISFAIVLPFIIYAEKKRRMKEVFIGCVALLCLTEIILLFSPHAFWIVILGVQLFFVAFNLLEALLPSLISKESPAGYKGTAMGIYATSQFIGVAIGGSLSGWLLGLGGADAVFMASALIAALWLLVSSSMQQPPYVSSLRIALPAFVIQDITLEKRIKAQTGVVEAIVIAAEQNAYVKIDTQQTSRRQLEQFINGVQ